MSWSTWYERGEGTAARRAKSKPHLTSQPPPADSHVSAAALAADCLLRLPGVASAHFRKLFRLAGETVLGSLGSSMTSTTSAICCICGPSAHLWRLDQPCRQLRLQGTEPGPDAARRFYSGKLYCALVIFSPPFPISLVHLSQQAGSLRHPPSSARQTARLPRPKNSHHSFGKSVSWPCSSCSTTHDTADISRMSTTPTMVGASWLRFFSSMSLINRISSALFYTVHAIDMCVVAKPDGRGHWLVGGNLTAKVRRREEVLRGKERAWPQLSPYPPATDLCARS